MTEVSLGNLVARVGLDTSPLNQGLGAVQGVFSKIPPLALGVAGAVAGVGIAAFKIGENFDQAYDQIRVGTGRTGAELDSLKDSFKNVVKDVPTDFGKASSVITELSQRTSLTGKPLEELSKQLLEVSRITGGDLSSNVQGASQLFANWNIPAEKMESTLDLIFKTSQKTGAGFGDLLSQTTAAGPVMRQLGFDMGDTAVLMGKMTKEGIDSGQVMAGMSKALATMAKAGEAPKETFARLVEEIKNSKDPIEANQIALELFGARAGPKMAAAIREGRLEIGELKGAIEGSKDTITGAADDTADLGEKWTEFKNKLLVAIEPFATGVFDIVGKVFDGLIFVFDRIGAAWNFLSGLWKENSGAMAGDTEGTFTKIKDTIQSVMDAVSAIISTVTAVIKTIWELWGSDIMVYLKNTFDNIMQVIGGVLDVIRGIFEIFAGIFTGDWSRVWDGVKLIFEGIWKIIGGILEQVLNALGLILTVAGDLLYSLWVGIWTRVKQFFSDFWEGVKSEFNANLDVIKGIPGRILSALGNLGELLVNAGKDVLRGLFNGIEAMKDWFKSKLIALVKAILPDPVEELLGIRSPSKLFEGYGENVVAGLRKGIQGNFGSLRGVVNQMGTIVRAGDLEFATGGRGGGRGGGADVDLTMHVTINGATEPGRITDEIDRAGAKIVDRLLRELRGG